MLTRNGLEHSTDFPEIIDIALLGALSNFIEPSNGLRLKTCLRGIIRRKHNFHFDFDGKLPTLHPPLSFFASFTHG